MTWDDVARACLALPGTTGTVSRGVYSTTADFDGYPVVLAQLDAFDEAGLVELAGEAWACRAPRRLLAERSSPA